MPCSTARPGLAWERLSRVTTTLFLIPPSTDFTVTRAPQDRFGWVAGIGGEFRLGASNWIGRIEYLHYDFGGRNVLVNNTGLTVAAAAQPRGSYTSRFHTEGNLVRAGFSYKFNGL